MGVVRNLFDGLTNALTGAGTSTDPRVYNRYRATFMSPMEIDQAYRGSAIMRKAIDKPATEMVREWRDWQAESADIELLEAEEKRLQLKQKVRQAEIMRGLGGGAMVLYVNADNQAAEVNPATIKQGGLQTIHVWHRSQLTLGPLIVDWADPWFGHPGYYEVQLTGAAGPTAVKFHPSRVVAFKGDPVTNIAGNSWLDAFWGQSKVQTIIDAVSNSDAADAGFSALIKDARNRRVSIPGLLDLVATVDGEQKIMRRMQALATGESSYSVTVLDGGRAGTDGKTTGAETIEDRQMAWAGMPDLMNAFRGSAAAAVDMPVTVLWGTSPGGLNATGASDLALWSKTVKGRQDLDLSPCMTQIDAVLVPSALGHVDPKIWYQWAPLEAQTEQEEATTFWNFMQGLQILDGLTLVPTIAMEKAVQNLLSERGWLPGIEDALSELSEAERFPSLSEPETGADGQLVDPSALVAPIQQGGGGQQSGRAPVQPMEATARRRAANDALKAVGLSDAAVDDVMAMIDAESGDV